MVARLRSELAQAQEANKAQKPPPPQHFAADDERVSKLHLQNQQLPLPQRRDSMPFLYVLVAPGSPMPRSVAASASSFEDGDSGNPFLSADNPDSADLADQCDRARDSLACQGEQPPDLEAAAILSCLLIILTLPISRISATVPETHWRVRASSLPIWKLPLLAPLRPLSVADLSPGSSDLKTRSCHFPRRRSSAQHASIGSDSKCSTDSVMPIWSSTSVTTAGTRHRRVAQLLSVFRRQSHGQDPEGIFELVRPRLFEQKVCDLRSDLATMLELLGQSVPANDEVWIRTTGREHHPSKQLVVQRLQLLLVAKLARRLKLRDARAYVTLTTGREHHPSKQLVVQRLQLLLVAKLARRLKLRDARAYVTLLLEHCALGFYQDIIFT
eukprot:s8004_g5.t1